MARVAWTDERVDDLAGHMDAGFERMSRDIRDLRVEVRHEIGGVRSEMREEIGGLRTELREEIAGLGSELRGEIGGLRGEMAQEFQALRTTMWRVGGGMIVALGGAMAAFSLNGS